MAKNDFKAFAIGNGANVTTQSDYESLAVLSGGFQSGKASSAQINKVLRQSSFIAAAFAQHVSNKTNSDVLDNGDLPGFIEKIDAAYAASFTGSFGEIGWRKFPDGSIEQWGAAITGSNGLVNIIFPIPFSQGCYSILGTISSRGNIPGNNISYDPPSASGFTMYSSSPSGSAVTGTGFSWRALGK